MSLKKVRDASEYPNLHADRCIVGFDIQRDILDDSLNPVMEAYKNM